MSQLHRFRELEAQGIDILSILAGDSGVDDEQLKLLLDRLGPLGEEYHSDLMELLTHRRFDETEALGLWKGVVRHKRKMETALGRVVGVRVAAADYLTNRRPLLEAPRIVPRQEMEQLLSQVNLDVLTGLRNRRSIDEALRLEMQRTRRYGGVFTVLLIDLDHFKGINDQQGHVAGDEVLVEISRRIQSACRETDTAGRWGGDELLVILPQTGPIDAGILSGRLRHDVRHRPIALHNGEFQDVTISIGISSYPEHGTVAQELVDSASSALRQAKKSGRDAEAVAGVTSSPPGRGTQMRSSRQFLGEDSPPPRGDEPQR
ncbi:MAG: GGDEF domain-containing protein [Planctomycetes bacterium]|jgi:diguanylate cyclase (GGDEF)-like protein|nr:GGDEF domain-containing protein [Planctomycetota bacterium]